MADEPSEKPPSGRVGRESDAVSGSASRDGVKAGSRNVAVGGASDAASGDGSRDATTGASRDVAVGGVNDAASDDGPQDATTNAAGTHDGAMAVASGPATIRWRWLAVLVALAVAGAWLGAPSREHLAVAFQRIRDLELAVVATVIAGALGLVVTEALRIAVIGRLVGARVRPRDAWDAAVANHVMTAVTPQVGLGEPTVAYLLGKRGVPWDAAVAIPFIKFTTSLALVFALGAILVIAGFGPHVDARIEILAVVVFVAIAGVTLVVIHVAARPALAQRWTGGVARWLRRRRSVSRWLTPDRIDGAARIAMRTVDRVAAVRRGRWRDTAILVAIHLVYYASYIAPLVGLSLVLGDPPIVSISLRALVYLCFVFAMPTPGGAGPSEAAAVVMFGDLLPAGDAIAVVILFRASTFYLQLAIGVVYLPIATWLGRLDAAR